MKLKSIFIFWIEVQAKNNVNISCGSLKMYDTDFYKSKTRDRNLGSVEGLHFNLMNAEQYL